MNTESGVPVMTIRLVGKTESGWVLEGTEKTANPIALATSGSERIPTESTVLEKQKDGTMIHKRIRHIYGCPIIDLREQEKEGWKPNTNGEDNIWVDMGELSVAKEGSSVGTYLYLKNYEGNVSNPLRPPTAVALFEEVIASEVAADEVDLFDKQKAAYDILAEIRSIDEKGDAVYDEDKLALYTSLFGLGALDTDVEKFRALLLIAQQSPEKITNGLSASRKKIYAEINKAESLAAISFDDNRVSFQNPVQVILVFKSKGKMAQMKEFGDFLLSKEGNEYYSLMLNKAQAAADATHTI